MVSRLSSSTAIVLAILLAAVTLGLAIMGEHLYFLFACVFLFMIIGVPVAIALAGSSLLFIVMQGTVPDLVVVHRMINGVDSFPLLAVPFFILAGSLMNTVGVTNRIFDFAKAVVGWLPGGLGHVNVGASIIFAGMSGAAVADAGGLGMIEIKAMRDAGYDDDFSVGVTAASSTIGPIIPPSLPMVIYGVMANASIGQLFAAGFLPGLLMGAALMGMVAYMAHQRGYPRDQGFSFRRLVTSFFRAFMSLMTPIIIVGGILTGAFTPTEAAVAAVVYAAVLGIFYRTLTLKRLVFVSMETFETTAVIMLIVAGASIFAWILTSTRVTELFVGFAMETLESKVLVLLMVNVILLVVGCFMETIAAITILVPVLVPLAIKVGIDPVHFGVVMVLNLMIGLLTPPVGMVLYVLSRVSGRSFEQCFSGTAPFLVPLVIVLVVITFMPEVSLWLPNLIYR